MIVAGLGFRKNASANAIAGIIADALAAVDIDAASLNALATASEKGFDAGFLETARRLRLRVILVGEAELAEAGKRALTSSERVLAEKGVPSVAEAAALAAAGSGARLLGPRVTNREAACAIAIGEADAAIGDTE